MSDEKTLKMLRNLGSKIALDVAYLEGRITEKFYEKEKDELEKEWRRIINECK